MIVRKNARKMRASQEGSFMMNQSAETIDFTNNSRNHVGYGELSYAKESASPSLLSRPSSKSNSPQIAKSKVVKNAKFSTVVKD